jgi:hypothetical protein
MPSWSSSKPSSLEKQEEERDGKVLSDSETKKRRPGGWKAMPFILGLSFTLS